MLAGPFVDRARRAAALPPVLALAALLSILLLRFVVMEFVTQCSACCGCCIRTFCNEDDDDDDHRRAHRMRWKKQTEIKGVQYIDDDEEETELHRKYHGRRCCGANNCRRVIRSCLALGQFESLPPFTEALVLTLRSSRSGKPLRPSPTVESLHDLHVSEYLEESELAEGWRLGFERRRRLVYKTRVWSEQGQAFRRFHDERTQMYTYEHLLEIGAPYTYSIHGRASYQSVLRSQISTHQLRARKWKAEAQRKRERHRKERQKNQLEAVEAEAAKVAEAEAAEEEAKEKEKAERKMMKRELLPHEREAEVPRWVKLFDGTEVSYYYYDQKTGESVWDQPEEYNSPRHAYSIRWLLGERPRSALVIQQLFRACLAKKVYQKRYTEERIDDVGEVSDASGEKWRVRVDVESGETFYQHNKHGKRQWERPGDWQTHGENEHMDKIHQMIAKMEMPKK